MMDSFSKKSALFVFTKNYPYGGAEQYLANEQKYLAEKFDRVIFVPSEYFGGNLKKRELPERCEVLDLNAKVAASSARKKLGTIMGVYLFEFFRTRKKMWMLKRTRRYLGVLRHQLSSAHVFAETLEKEYSEFKCCHYAYWIHNSSILLGILKRQNRINGFVCRGHAIDLYEFDWKISTQVDALPYYNFIIHRADLVSSISQHGCDYLKARFPALEEKFVCSRLGVDDKGINPWNEKEIFTIVSCSGIDDRKRVYLIAKVVALMKTPVRWIHFGEGSGRAKLEGEVRKIPAMHSVELMGFVPNEKVISFYQQQGVSIFLNLSEAEGIPVAIMEAISFGIPVLATAVQGSPEIANNQTGFCLPQASSENEIAALLESFIADVEKQKKLRNSAREFYSQEFNATSNYRKFANMVSDALKNN
jgi:glycosyltransferase involved in cell wall biosynthesis